MNNELKQQTPGSSIEQALEYVRAIRDSQDAAKGGRQHSIPEWIMIARRQLQKAEDCWYNGEESLAIEKLGHTAACAVAALEQHAYPVDLTKF